MWSEISCVFQNKAGYTAIQSRTVGQEPLCENRLQLKNVTDGPTDGPTDTARCKVACPRLENEIGKQTKTLPLVKALGSARPGVDLLLIVCQNNGVCNEKSFRPPPKV